MWLLKETTTRDEKTHENQSLQKFTRNGNLQQKKIYHLWKITTRVKIQPMGNYNKKFLLPTEIYNQLKMSIKPIKITNCEKSQHMAMKTKLALPND